MFNFLVIRALATVHNRRNLVINYSFKSLSSPWLHYQKSFKLGDRWFTVSSLFRKESWYCTEESLSTKGPDVISILCGYLFLSHVTQMAVCPFFLSQGSVDSAVGFFCLVGVFLLLRFFQSKEYIDWYGIVFHNLLVFWIARELKLTFFFLAEVCAWIVTNMN